VSGGTPSDFWQHPPAAPEPDPAGRRSKILGGVWQGEGAVGVAIAVASAIVFFGVLGWLIVHSAGWPAVKESFFNGEVFKESFPKVLRAFVRNVALFMTAEAVVLVFALFLAVLRSLPGPVFFPVRALAIVYIDLFRGIPTILVIYLLGLGAPPLGEGVPSSPFFWGVVSLVLVYSAYVAEVYRAGIESIHPSQVAAARALGLSRWKSLRHVVIPQAVRRVIPPLLNDFIGLQKDTALVASIGVIESFRTAQIESARTFNFTPYVCTALLFILLTIPLARFTDVLIARERRRRETGAQL
jgi:polar amino acid transport system permease protein